MKLKDILDMGEYLQNRCYCPGEIYSDDGFGYQIFKEESDCELIGETDKPYNFIAVVCASVFDNAQPQVLIIFRNNEKTAITNIVRYDATENNIKLVKEFINGRVEKADFDEYNPGETARSVKEILSIADAIMID